jgi:hypothetical protein
VSADVGKQADPKAPWVASAKQGAATSAVTCRMCRSPRLRPIGCATSTEARCTSARPSALPRSASSPSTLSPAQRPTGTVRRMALRGHPRWFVTRGPYSRKVWQRPHHQSLARPARCAARVLSDVRWRLGRDFAGRRSWRGPRDLLVRMTSAGGRGGRGSRSHHPHGPQALSSW